MPYRLLVCKDCDYHVCQAGPHGPEDEYCEGEGGFEYVEAFTSHEIRQRLTSDEAIETLMVGVREDPPSALADTDREELRGAVRDAARACHLLPRSHDDVPARAAG